MNLHLIGDVHGKVGEYLNIVQSFPMGDKSIQLGDMGIGFPKTQLFTLPRDHKFIRGNHDCPEFCWMHPNYLSDYGYDADNKIFHVAGAFSIDYAWRVEGISWWRDEELSYAELDKVVDLYAESKPEIMLTHECPSYITNLMFQKLASTSEYYAGKLDCGRSRTSAALQRMFEIHQPKLWFFGHYHLDMTLELDGTTFRCLSELAHTSIELEDPIVPPYRPNVGFIQPEQASS